MDWEDFKDYFWGVFGLMFLLLVGIGGIWTGFNDEFSIGQLVESTLTRNSRPIGDSIIREYGYFDVFKRRVLPIFIGTICLSIVFFIIKNFFSSEED
jgi:hypothetical protein